MKIMLERKKKTKMGSFSNKRIAVIIVILVTFTSLEVYAHTYVQIHDLIVVTEEDARKFLTWQDPTGTYKFSKSGCRWFIGWIIRRPAPQFGYVYIFKIEQNGSFLVSYKDLLILGLEVTSNITDNFLAHLDEIYYASNHTEIRIDYNFGEIGTYQISLGLHVRVYERTLLGLIPQEKVTIPMNATIYYGP